MDKENKHWRSLNLSALPLKAYQLRMKSVEFCSLGPESVLAPGFRTSVLPGARCLVILASSRPAEPPVPANDPAVTRPCLPIRLPRLLYLPMCLQYCYCICLCASSMATVFAFIFPVQILYLYKCACTTTSVSACVPPVR